jgi:outer membrane protein TolC
VDAANQSPIVVAAQNERDLALLALKRLVNVPADVPLVLTTRLAGEDATMPVLAADTLGAPERASVRAAEATVRVWEQAVTAARADRWPSLTVGATFSHQAFLEEIAPFDAQFRRSWNADVGCRCRSSSGSARSERRTGPGRRSSARAERDQVELAELEVGGRWPRCAARRPARGARATARRRGGPARSRRCGTPTGCRRSSKCPIPVWWRNGRR